MSRTYRIRHLPTLGIARKFAWSTNKFTDNWRWARRGRNVPIISPHWHPWVKYRANTPSNAFWRKLAHSKMRHRERQILSRVGSDFDAIVMPVWYEHFDPWNFD